MSAVLHISAAGALSVWRAEVAELLYSDAEALDICRGKRVCVVFDDVAYASDLYPVSLVRRAERNVMAEARFKELAGDAGLGSWCIIPREKSRHLYLFAVDPECAAYSRLLALVVAGLDVARVSSDLLLERVPAEFSASACLLRVRRRGQSLQFALRLQGHWVFVRCVDVDSDSLGDTVESTLQYIRAQGYCEREQAIDWDIQRNLFSDGAFAALRGERDEVSYRADESLISESRTSRFSVHNSFNRMNGLLAMGCQMQHRPVLNAAGTVAILVALMLLPAVLLRLGPVAEPIPSDAIETLSAVHQTRFDNLQLIRQRALFSLEPVREVGDLMVQKFASDKYFELLGLYVDGPFSMRLRCRFTGLWSDPLMRQNTVAELQRSLQAVLRTTSVRVADAQALEVGGAGGPQLLELLLELPRETS